MTTRRLPVSSAPPFRLGPLAADGEYEAWLASRPVAPAATDGARKVEGSGIAHTPAVTPSSLTAGAERLSGVDPGPADGAAPSGTHTAAPAPTPTGLRAAGVGVTPGGAL